MKKKYVIITCLVLLIWFFLDMIGVKFGDKYLVSQSFSEDGVKLTNGDGLTITPDEMEIKLPDRLLKNRQDRYYEQRKKFYDSIFKKEG